MPRRNRSKYKTEAHSDSNDVHFVLCLGGTLSISTISIPFALLSPSSSFAFPQSEGRRDTSFLDPSLHLFPTFHVCVRVPINC